MASATHACQCDAPSEHQLHLSAKGLLAMLLAESAVLQFAGNVLVYGALSPSDGDWFGGIHADNADHFLEALLNLDVSISCGIACKRQSETCERQSETCKSQGMFKADHVCLVAP